MPRRNRNRPPRPPAGNLFLRRPFRRRCQRLCLHSQCRRSQQARHLCLRAKRGHPATTHRPHPPAGSRLPQLRQPFRRSELASQCNKWLKSALDQCCRDFAATCRATSTTAQPIPRKSTPKRPTKFRSLLNGTTMAPNLSKAEPHDIARALCASESADCGFLDVQQFQHRPGVGEPGMCVYAATVSATRLSTVLDEVKCDVLYDCSLTKVSHTRALRWPGPCSAIECR